MRLLSEMWEGFRIAINAIRVQKLRSVLTTLGIIIGITTVTLMVAAINGIEKKFDDSLSQLGTDVVYVTKFPWGFNSDWWNFVNRPPIQESLVGVIGERSTYVRAVAPWSMTNATVSFRENSFENVTIEGGGVEYADIRNVSLTEGRFYADVDYRGSKNVAVIGADIAEGLFPFGSAIGKEFRVGRNRYVVIGQLERRGTDITGQSQDNLVVIPHSTYKKHFGINWWSGVTIMVKLSSPDVVEEAKDELTGILRSARNVDAAEGDNFSINEQASIREQMAPVKTAIYGIGIFLTALSLVVGGIGVMNIMFVSVKERTKEIGIRKAIGAMRRSILFQFLIEAIVICLVGGVIGLAISGILLLALSSVMEAIIDIPTVLYALLICTIIGVTFGLAPAWKAATAEPITALRYE